MIYSVEGEENGYYEGRIGKSRKERISWWLIKRTTHDGSSEVGTGGVGKKHVHHSGHRPIITFNMSAYLLPPSYCGVLCPPRTANPVF
jgi:hypothetical protein